MPKYKLLFRYSMFGHLPEKWQAVCIILLVFGVFSIWSLYFLTYFLIGGSAGKGLVKDGEYFVGDMGNYTNVSKLTYYYSLTLDILAPVISIICTLIGIIICMYFQKRK